jgi:hypothetical protein
MDGFRKPLSVPILVVWRGRRWLRRAGLDGNAVAIPLLIVALGANWLFDSLGTFPAIEWTWTGNIATLGIYALLFRRWNRINFVVGMLLVIAALLSLLQQNGAIREVIEAPFLMIVFGGLLLVAKFARVPIPYWMKPVARRQLRGVRPLVSRRVVRPFVGRPIP